MVCNKVLSITNTCKHRYEMQMISVLIEHTAKKILKMIPTIHNNGNNTVRGNLDPKCTGEMNHIFSFKDIVNLPQFISEVQAR